MAKPSTYSATFKEKMVQRMLSPNARPLRLLARDAGVPEGTLYRWRNAATLGAMAPKRKDDSQRPARPAEEWTADEKLALVLEAAAVPDGDLGEFLRRRGVHEAQLRAWRTQALAGLSGGPPRRSAEEGRRIRALERELKRKDKALAETAALLVLKKKAQEIWGDADDDTDPTPDE